MDLFTSEVKDKRFKLNFLDVQTIRDMVASKEFSIKEIAANYGVSRQTIWRVCKEEMDLNYV